MLWGAGRLLVHAASAAWSAILTLVRTAAGKLSSADPRRVKGLAAAVVLVGLLGPGRPVLVAIKDSTPLSGAGAIEQAAGEGTGGSIAGRDGWRATVRVEGLRKKVVLPPPPPAAKRTALIIGINRARGGRALPGSVTDATHMRDALIGYGFPKKNVTMLLEEEASRKNITKELARLAARTPADGVAVFAVATHTRRRGGTNEFLTADGERVSAPELATALGKVRSKMWVNLATCFAGGYDLPGITGDNRVVTFASSSAEPTYQLGSAGSYLVINMVQSAMLDGRAPGSVESAFRYAHKTLTRDRPNRVPSMSDGVKGELVLGRMSEELLERHEDAGDPEPFFASEPKAESAPPSADAAEEAPEPEADPGTKSDDGGLGVCGRVSWSCSRDD